MARKSNRCSDCNGSGRCEGCYGAGVNLHFNEAEPLCRACKGTSRCTRCVGTGSVAVPPFVALDAPIAVRVVLSAIPAFLLYKTLFAQEPVHFGRGGPILPKAVGWLSMIAVAGPVLYQIWKDVKHDDVPLVSKREMITLFRDLNDDSTSEPSKNGR